MLNDNTEGNQDVKTATLPRPSSHVHFETQGSGSPVVLIHAINTGSRKWHHHMSVLEDRAELITYDTCGVGKSGDFAGIHRLKDQIADDSAAILDETGHAVAFICGVSFGGVIAQHFATRYPHRARGLMVVDSYGDTRPLSPSKAA